MANETPAGHAPPYPGFLTPGLDSNWPLPPPLLFESFGPILRKFHTCSLKRGLLFKKTKKNKIYASVSIEFERRLTMSARKEEGEQMTPPRGFGGGG